MDRFQPVFTGYKWHVVDRDTQDWFKMDTKKAAYEKAADWNYQSDTIEGGKITDRGTYV